MKFTDLKYLTAYLIPICAILGILNPAQFSYLTPIVTFGIVPVLELFTPQLTQNLSETDKTSKANHPFFDWLLHLNLPVVYFILGFSLFTLEFKELNTVQLVGLVISVGIVLGSNGINVAHELGHRDNRWSQLAAKLLLLPSFYTHFTLEHNFGHHAKVSTPEDPATAKLNQSVFSFWFTSSIRQYKSAWRLQKQMLNAKNHTFWSIHNSMLINTTLQFLYIALLFILFSWQTAVLAMSMGVIGFLLLESINYIEHYGLLRKKRKSGRYYPVREIHSWNSNHLLGRILLYELTRHSDHHYRASKNYQLLDYYSTSPELPYGYPTSILIALIPPLWFALMNPRIPGDMRALASQLNN
ncbi:alkane 1-monooxygenase [Psychroflexus sediminis]|uniref:Alkane 1-monooxygenase n=1 Tax=Psychroflexus sediminis TaxID=470826 RepID=A0A1G7VIA2_9FLAO|nr:alkane 1-monooxygenase [Psychroflexus sediminis]SDG58660.1 alkane 1-monooxygenase [Psychroflexus sediminis]